MNPGLNAVLFEMLLQQIALIALNLNRLPFNGSARSTFLLQGFGQLF